MFHSLGTVQSSTGVPVGSSWRWIGMCCASTSSVSPDAVAGDAAADREHLGGEGVDLLPDDVALDRWGREAALVMVKVSFKPDPLAHTAQVWWSPSSLVDHGAPARAFTTNC